MGLLTITRSNPNPTRKDTAGERSTQDLRTARLCGETRRMLVTLASFLCSSRRLNAAGEVALRAINILPEKGEQVRCQGRDEENNWVGGAGSGVRNLGRRIRKIRCCRRSKEHETASPDRRCWIFVFGRDCRIRTIVPTDDLRTQLLPPVLSAPPLTSRRSPHSSTVPFSSPLQECPLRNLPPPAMTVPRHPSTATKSRLPPSAHHLQLRG